MKDQDTWQKESQERSEEGACRAVKPASQTPGLPIFLIVFVVLLVGGASAWFLGSAKRFGFSEPLSDLRSSRSHAPASQPESEPPIASAPLPSALPQPRTLEECLGSDRVINEAVRRCLYGQRASVDAPRADGQGMVSEQYLARYRAERDQRFANARRSATVHVERTSTWIKKWSGEGFYRAEWDVIDNDIDGSSVCANHRRGSIEFRECRKAAKQYFTQQCRAWRERVQNERRPPSEQLQQRYCSASNQFNPMG